MIRDNTRNKTEQMGTDFTHGSIYSHLITFMLPLLLAGILNSIYNTVDTIVVGQVLGTAGNVAVSTGGRVMMIITLFSMSMASAGQIIISQLVGSGRRQEMNDTIGTFFSLLGIISAGLSLIFLLLSRNLITWLQTPDTSFDGALAYLRITSLGMPLLFGYNASCAILRGMGDSKRPLIFIAIAAVVNLLLDLLFVVRMGMGAAGTAWATFIGQGVSFFFAIIFLYRRREAFGFDFRLKSFRLKGEIVKLILKIGLPMSANGLFISGTQVFMQGFINACGEVQSAAYNVADKVLTIESVFSTSIQQAGSSIVAQNIGAGKTDRVSELVRKSLVMGLAIASLTSLIVCLFPEQIFRMFINDGDVIKGYSHVLMYLSVIPFVISAVNSAFYSVTIGTGFSTLTLFAGFMDGVVLRIALGLIFGLVMGKGVIGYYMGHCFARLAPVSCNLWYYISGRWKTRKILK